MLVLSQRSPETNPRSANLNSFCQLVDRRLTIAQKGLDEARQYLAAGHVAEVEMVLDKIDEDLHLLRRRLSSEAETTARRPTVLYGHADAASETN